jgi:phosphate transport system substrate-binding protein
VNNRLRATISVIGALNVKISSKRFAAFAVVAAVALAACGDDDEASDTTVGEAAPATTEAMDDTATTEAMDDTATTEAMDDTATTEAMGEGSDTDLSALSGSIFVSGSSTVEPISIAAGNAFADMAPGVAVTVEGPGTGDGFAKFCNGETDVSDASRAIKAEEVEACEAAGIEFIELVVAVDGLSVITSVENTAVECLSFVDLYALLGPDATGLNNWADASAVADEIATTVTDLGAVNTPYPDAPLSVTAPGEESGTFDSFVELVIAEVGDALGVEDANVRPDYTASPNDNVIIEGISANPTSLGWVGFAFVEENLDVVKPLQIDGGDGCVEPTPETIASGEFPIARDLFIYVNANNLETNEALAPFIDFYVNEAITTLVGAGDGQVPYVPVNDETLAETQRVWAELETGTRVG